MAKRIAVIGAGASGLPAIKCCLDEDLIPVCFEQSDSIGGLWHYTDEIREGQGCVMKSTVINVSKEMMAFSDFLIPKEYPMFMHNKLVQKYLDMYAEHFNLKKHIQFKKRVITCKPADNFYQNGQWILLIKDLETGQTYDEVFDGVMAASGHHTEPLMPTFDGQDRFKGKILHTRYYRDFLEFTGKRVLVIGLGNSGGDIANELSRISSKVVLSTRSGSWVIPRVGDNGMPFDMMGTTRAIQCIQKSLPNWLLNKLTEKAVNARFDHETYGIKPSYPPRAQDPLISDEFHLRIANGLIQIKPNVKNFTETDVTFVDGTHFKDVDVVIFATGFQIGLPYLDKTITEVRNNVVNLYKFIFPPDLTKSTLAIIGCVQPLGSITPISELQCRLATRVFKGIIRLPSSKEMWDDIYLTRQEISKHYHKSLRHTVVVDFIDYMDELAEIVGCKPKIGKLWLKDPKLAYSCVFGPNTAYQYRLMGPLPWTGAREAILTQWERTLYPLTKALPRPTKKAKFPYILFFSAVVIAALCILCMEIDMYKLYK